MSKWLPGAMLSLVAASSANAALLHDLFQDHVVLQRGAGHRILGSCRARRVADDHVGERELAKRRPIPRGCGEQACRA